MIKVVIERHCKPGQEERLEEFLRDLRASCMHNPTYVSGETLVNLDDPLNYFVIGTWSRLDGWQNWQNCQERHELLQMMTPCIEGDPIVKVFTAGDGELNLL